MSKKYNILLVLCGGTICSTVEKRNGRTVRGIKPEEEVMLKQNYEHSDSCFIDEVNIEETRNYGILSENMTIDKWNKLIRDMKSINYEKYDGIIFAHGTDTLAYSSSLFSLLFKDMKKPIFLVSSQLPLTEEGANGDDNFKAAVELICCGIKPNVYVTYRNPENNIENRTHLHLGSRLIQCKSYDNNFYSEGAILLPAKITSENANDCLKNLPEIEDTRFDRTISFRNNWELSNCVLKIEPYVGLDYSSYNYDKYKAVVHGTYHSGTICENQEEYANNKSNDSFLSLIDRPNRNFNVFISPSDEDNVYESFEHVLEFSGNHGGIDVVHGITDEMAYIKLLIAYSLGNMKHNEVLEFINTDIAGEMAYC